MKRYQENGHVYLTKPDANTSFEDRLTFLKRALDVPSAWSSRNPTMTQDFHQARLGVLRYGEPVTVEGVEMSTSVADGALQVALQNAILSDDQYSAWYGKLNHARETSQVKQLRHMELVDRLLQNPDVFLDSKRAEQVQKLVGVLVKQYDIDETIGKSFACGKHDREFYQENDYRRVFCRLVYFITNDKLGDALALLMRASEYANLDDEIPSLVHANRMERLTTYSDILEQVLELVKAQASASFHAHV